MLTGEVERREYIINKLIVKKEHDAGYGIDKMLAWEPQTKGKVEFASDLVCSTITYWFGEQAGGQVQILINLHAG